MASAAALTINDRLATPTAHVFTPRPETGSDVATFVETASVPIGERSITVSTRKSGGKLRVKVRVQNPTLVTEIINAVSVPKVPRTAYAELTLTFDLTSSLQERQDTVGYMANLMLPAQTMMDAALTKGEPIW